MLDALEYMHSEKVVHRDLKLDNILVDKYLNLKIADFGFAKFKSIHRLKSFKGSNLYMAPEIIEGKTYDGVAVDIFSTAVVLFILVLGFFPFKQAKKVDDYYSLIFRKDLDIYW